MAYSHDHHAADTDTLWHSILHPTSSISQLTMSTPAHLPTSLFPACMQAHAIGRHCLVPLSLTAADLQLASAPSTSLSQGTQSSVLAGRLGGQDVVVKKVRISGAADLDRYRNELRALAQCNHPHIIALLGEYLDYMSTLESGVYYMCRGMCEVHLGIEEVYCWAQTASPLRRGRG